MFETEKIKKISHEEELKKKKEAKKEDKKKKKDIVDQSKVVQEEIGVIETEKAYKKGLVSVRDIISPSAFKITSDFLRLNNLYVRTMFVITYPRYLTVGWFAPIITESITLDVSMFFYPIKINVVLKQLKNKVGALEAQLMSDHEKGAPRDPISETALRDIEGLRDSLTQGTEKFFQFALYVTVYAKTKEDLDLMTDEVENILGAKLIYSRKALYQTEQGFNSTLPLGNDELFVSFNMNSSPIASSFPFMSAELSSDSGVLYGINRHNNSLILFDRFSMQNANGVIFATSGAGKSYTIKLEVLRSLMVGIDVIIIDPEKEYGHLASAVGGAFINISLNSETKLNPFDLPAGVGGESKPEDVIRSAVITMKGMIRLMIGDITNVEDSLLDRALIETYAKKDITADSDLTNIEPPLMADLEEVLLSMDGGEDMALRIKKYTEGTFSGMFNSPTNINVSNQLVVFSIRDLEDELRPIAMYMVVNYIWNIIRSEMKQRVLVVDEAWIMMQNEDSAKFMFALVKRCRKYYLGVTTITQDVNDFLTSQYGRAIVSNSAIQLLLKQSPSAVDIIQKTFMLTDGEKYLLLESGLGEGIFFAGSKHAAIRIQASYTENSIVTSDPKQLLELEESKKEFEESLLAANEEETAPAEETTKETTTEVAKEETAPAEETTTEVAKEETAPENMSKRKKIIITIVSIFLIFLFFNLLKDEEVIDLNTFNKIEEEEKEIVLEYEVNSSDLEYEAVTKESARETNLELLLINLAKNFVERFGSWSTDNQGENLEELLPLSTAKMKQYLNNIILNYEITEFYGLSTKALATEIIFLDEEEGEAIILVNTQRIETLDDLSTEVYYQDIELYIILAGDKWLIEETKW